MLGDIKVSKDKINNMKKKQQSHSKKSSKFFMKLFLIPYICWFVFTIFAMSFDESEVDPITWSDIILFNIFILIIWFVIFFIILKVVSKYKKQLLKLKKIEENQFIITTKRIINIVIKAILIILWSIIVLSLVNSFEGIIFPFVLLIFGLLIIYNFVLLNRIKEQKKIDGQLYKNFRIIRIFLIIVNILIISFFLVLMDKTSDIDKNNFKKYMDKNVCIVGENKEKFENSKKYIINNYVTDNKKCDFLVGYVSFDGGNNIVFNEIIDTFKNGYNLKRDSIYQTAGSEKEVTMSGVFFDKKYNFVIFMKKNTIVYSLYKEGYNNQVKKMMSDLGYSEKHTFKSLLIN